jgi:4'-phosphopantetheinyl transferase
MRIPQRLRDGAVHVWRADIDAMSGTDYASRLPPSERARARRIVDPRRRERWARARGVLRELLGHYLDEDPRSLALARSENGKLSIRAPEPLHFNLAHSREVALYAFSRAGDVGVDVEAPRRRRGDELALAARAFGTPGAGRLAALTPRARALEFRRSWVRHEASLKLRGGGIFTARGGVLAHEPWVCDLDIGAGALAALALDRAPTELAHFDLNAERPSPVALDLGLG